MNHFTVFGLKELADLYDVSKQTMYQRFKQGYYRGFPEPAYVISSGKIWTYEQIQEYVKYQSGFESIGVRAKIFKMGQVKLKDSGVLDWGDME